MLLLTTFKESYFPFIYKRLNIQIMFPVRVFKLNVSVLQCHPLPDTLSCTTPLKLVYLSIILWCMILIMNSLFCSANTFTVISQQRLMNQTSHTFTENGLLPRYRARCLSLWLSTEVVAFSPRPHPYLPCFAPLSRERLSLHCSPN